MLVLADNRDKIELALKKRKSAIFPAMGARKGFCSPIEEESPPLNQSMLNLEQNGRVKIKNGGPCILLRNTLTRQDAFRALCAPKD